MKTLPVVLVILVFAVLLLHDVRGVHGSDKCSATSKSLKFKISSEILYSSNQISNDTWITNQTIHKSCVW